MRLLRPHIPLFVRCQVALRQTGHSPGWAIDRIFAAKSCARLLAETMAEIAGRLKCEVSNLHLDHDPALGAREKLFHKGVHVGYSPDANDPEALIYREAGAHRIKTNLRGDHGQHPDRVLIKKARRLTENKPPKRKVKIPSRGFGKASRPFHKRKM